MNRVARDTDGALRTIVYAADSAIHGRGVFALRAIAAGEYIGTFSGPETNRDGTYVLWVYREDDMAAPLGRCGTNLLRHLNHACPCNAEFDGFDLYAGRNIACGQEITIDYGFEP